MTEEKPAPLHLGEELFLGRGMHKAAYIDPRDGHRCIKVPFREPDVDIERELAYRRARTRRGLSSELLAAYYGTVETDRGTGYVFERVMDYDGSPSVDLTTYLQREAAGHREGWPEAPVVLEWLRSLLDKECLIIPHHCGLGNILVERRSPDGHDFSTRLIDDIGSNAKIPVFFYVDFLARRHAEKVWRHWVELMKEYSNGLVTDAFLKEHHLETLEG